VTHQLCLVQLNELEIPLRVVDQPGRLDLKGYGRS
jgi:hypothetical protein